MNNDDEQARRIAKLLDPAVENLTPEQQTKLAEARRIALARMKQTEVVAVPAAAPAGVGRAFSDFTERSVFGVRYLIPIAALVLGLIGITYMHNGNGPDIADIDAGLLTDDLPISAYLDQGFDSWLKRSPR